MKCGSTVRLLLAVTALVYCAGCSQRDEVASGSANPPILIEPRRAVGKIRTGMTTREVVQQLGEPNRRTANALEYTPLGFAVMPNQDGVVQVVMCGDVTGINGPLVKAFTGRTSEGIGLKSTREDLIKAYGQPSSSEKFRDRTESLSYDSLGITFTLESGKVYHMIVRLQPQQEPLPTVSLEPVPSVSGK